MTHDLTLRRATAADLPAVLALVRAVVPLMNAAGNYQWTSDYPNEEVFGQDIARQHLWVAERLGAIEGVAALTQDQDLEYADADWDATAPALVTHRLAVAPRRPGPGRGPGPAAPGRARGPAARPQGVARGYQLGKRGYPAAFPEAGLPVCGRNKTGVSAGAAVFLL